MPVSISLEGVDDIIKKLEEMGKKVDRLPNKILPEAGKPVLETAKTKVRKKTGKGEKGLEISKVKKENGRKYVQIGISKSDNSPVFYLKFLEYGTSKMAAHPFLQPAFEEKKNEVYGIIREMLKKELGL